MDYGTNKLYEFIEYLKAQDTKIAKRVYDYYNRDNINALIEYHGVWWIESNMSVNIPQYVYNYIDRYYAKKGFKWVFNT